MPARIPESLRPLLVPIDSISQHPDNPRNGDIDLIVESITVNGYVAPVVVQRSTNRIIAGNHRWQAMHALDATTIPAIFVDMSDEQAARYLIADNRTSDVAKNDEHLLGQMLAALAESDIGLIGTGFTEDEFHDLLTEASNDPLPESEGYGFALNGIWQVIVEFDNQADAEELQAHLADLGHQVRVVGL